MVNWGYLGLKCGDVFDLAIRAKNMGPVGSAQGHRRIHPIENGDLLRLIEKIMRLEWVDLGWAASDFFGWPHTWILLFSRWTKKTTWRWWWRALQMVCLKLVGIILRGVAKNHQSVSFVSEFWCCVFAKSWLSFPGSWLCQTWPPLKAN